MSLLTLAVLAPVAAAVVIAFATRAGDGKDFLTGSGGGSAFAVGAGQGASLLPACVLFALAGLEFQLGFDALCYGLGLAGGLVLAAVLIAPPLAAARAETVAGFIGRRFGRSARGLALLVVVLSSAMLLVAEATFAGTLAQRFLGIPAAAGAALLLAGAAACALPGGIRGAGRAQIALTGILAAGFLAPLFLLAAKAQGLVLPQLAYGETLPEIVRLETQMLEAGLADLDSFKAHASPFLAIDAANFAAIVVCLMTGTAVLAHVVGRLISAGNAREARLRGAWAALFAVLLLATVPAYAAYAKLGIYASIVGGAGGVASAFANDPVGLLAALPGLTDAPWLTAALLCAALAAALLATTSMLLLALATTVVRDAYEPLARTFGQRDDHSVPAARIVIVVAAACAAALAMARPETNPLALALAAFSVAAAGLFPALVLGTWWRRAQGTGATAAIALGLLVYLYYLIGTHYFAASFYETWSSLSDAAPPAVRKFVKLKSVVESAPVGAARTAAERALAFHAAGGPTRAGMANWFGLYSTSAAVFALPIGFAVMLLAGLSTPRSGPRKSDGNGT